MGKLKYLIRRIAGMNYRQFFQKIDDATVGTAYLDSALRNGMITVFVILMLAAGATLPILMMPSKAYTMTRRRVYPSQQNND
mgnify:CR=1 FL=1